jgi:hypothetical protein
MLQMATSCDTSLIALVERLTGENTMNTSFKTLLAISAAALLAACGGGGDSTAPPATFTQPAWASPAMFVPAGSNQVSVAVSDCTTAGGVSLAARAPLAALRSAGTAISTPTLVITSAGNVIFSGAVGTTTTVSELIRINFSDTTQRNIRLNANSSLNTFSSEVVNDYMRLNILGQTIQLNAYNSTRDEGYTCATVTAPAAQVPPSEARLAAVFTPGITSIQPFSVTAGASFVNNIAIWDNLGINLTLPANQTNARYAGLNITTGALTVGPSANAVTSTVALSIAGATSGYYEEGLRSNGTAVAGKTVQFEVQTTDRGLLKFFAEARGSVLKPEAVLGSFPAPVRV